MSDTRLNVGDRVKLGGSSRGEARLWWQVRAADERFVVLTRQAPFESKGTSLYTIIDYDRGVRGPCNLIGNGYDVDEPGGCDALLAELNAHLAMSAELRSLPAGSSVESRGVEVSHRNNVPIEVLAHESNTNTSNEQENN